MKQIKEKKTTKIAIVGGGAAGLIAAAKDFQR